MKKLSVTLLVMTLFSPLATTADVLNIDGNRTVVQNTNTPTRGMSKEQVLSRFGEPNTRRAAVGDPPISRWDYNGFSVYFEYEIVLHSLIRR